ncbi:histone methyltransferase set1 [Cladophialophora chaetospira]|uniref:Histone-lysine N-methyltransferase, H3 lysine-4 specific n=1 Tax=Cladophialophora chaetospira TaxID=386627 RepID=A0AA38X1A6_9EURO|nr:histone methyltransferase set1 [Cladophialophora chaetospira]
MSRPQGQSSHSKLADFFPTAPSVIQQRKSSKLPELDKSKLRRSDERVEDANAKENHLRRSLNSSSTTSHPLSPAKQETEHSSCDLLNGVGSASSSSTASSVFSAPLANATMSGANHLNLSTLTPLTSSDSPTNGKLISPTGDSGSHTAMASSKPASLLHQGSMTPLHTPPTHRRTARDTNSDTRGTRCTYDPELDKNLNSKDKRKLKAQFQDFGTKPEDNIQPPDPRLSIPNYTKGVVGKGKAKYRPAPYNLKSWSADAATAVAPLPATTVVVTGFDPMAPLSQINALFSSFGEIEDLDNKTDPVTGRFLGICSIAYRDCASFQGGGPISAVLAAKTAYLEGKRGQRIGLKTVQIVIDRDGSVTDKMVERAIALHRKESGFTNQSRTQPSPSPVSTPVAVQSPGFAKSTGPPPTAPKGPSGKPSLRPQSTFSSPFTLPTKPERPSKPASAPTSSAATLVESTPIADTLKVPYIFIAHCYVPVMVTTIPHLKKRMRMYDWRDVRCDETGYFITFEQSRNGQMEAKKVFNGCHMQPLFTYVMNLELHLNGNHKAISAADPSPVPVLAATSTGPVDFVYSKQAYRLRKEHDLDLEEEKRQRARDLDPSRAVVQLVIQELRDKLLEDVKSRSAAPILYDYLDPTRHAERRRALGVVDPDGTRKPALGTEGSQTPDSRMGIGRRPLGNKNLNILSLPKIGKRPGTENLIGYRDERRKAPPRQNVRSLFHQLSQFHREEEDSDDEQRTSVTRDTEDFESRPPSRMSMTSVSDDDDELLRKATKRRLHAREESEMGDNLAKDEVDTSKQTAEDLIISKLERNIYEMSPSSRKRKRLVKELEARKRQKADDELFGVAQNEFEREQSEDIKVETPVEATPDVESDATKVKKPKPKKKTKKQIREEQEALRQAQAEAEAAEIVDNVLEYAEEEEALAEAAEWRPEVEWGVSAEEPLPTVDDDEDIIADLRGWQASLFDEEDLEYLAAAMKPKKAMDIGDPMAWAWKQERIRNLNPGTQPGALRTDPMIGGYYVPNASGSARTEPIRKILESEKSKYLPHRIKVQKAREKREAEAKKDPGKQQQQAPVELPKASSRGKRADDRRTVKDLDRQREMLQSMGEDADVLRFNQLQKRKKPVKFARSAIHNWGLYSLERIQTSEMIIEYVGEKIRQEVADLREIKYTESGIGSSYLFRIDEGTVVDATKKGGIARFINHSCSPNCTAKIIRVGGTKRIVIYALRDIEKDEELTYDYKFERITMAGYQDASWAAFFSSACTSKRTFNKGAFRPTVKWTRRFNAALAEVLKRIYSTQVPEKGMGYDAE